MDNFLKFWLENAEEEIIVSSPWIKIRALSGMVEELRYAVSRAEVHIYTSLEANTDEDPFNPDYFDIYSESFSQGIRKLREIGVNVHPLYNTHNKTLVIDRKIFVDGSFNWLSAWRKPNHPYTLHDSALIISGRRADFHTKQFLEAQYKLRHHSSPLLLDQDDANRHVADFVMLLNNDLDIYNRHAEPTYNSRVKPPISEPMYFAVHEEFAHMVSRRGIDTRMLDFNDQLICVARSEAQAIETALLMLKNEELIDEPGEFAIFEIDREKLPEDLHLTGKFSRANPYTAMSSSLTISEVVPASALRRNPTVFVRE